MALSYGKNWNPVEYYKNDDIAENYDRERFSGLSGRIYNFLEKRMIRQAFAELPRSAAIADIPCGTGRLAEVLLDMGFSVTGIDIAQPMLEVARRRLRRFAERFVTRVADARELGATERSFDAALCARVLMHFPLAEQIVFLRSVAAAAKRRVVFTQGLDTPYHRLRRRIKKLLRNEAPSMFPLTQQEMRMLIEAAGLREIRRYSLLPMVSEAVIIVCEPTTGASGLAPFSIADAT